MNREELAALLTAASDERARRALLDRHPTLCDAPLAHALKDICLMAWSGDPPRAVAAADALTELAARTGSDEVIAVCAWGAGVAALVKGRMEEAVSRLDDAEARFHELGQPHAAASTQVSKLIALAMLGRYDEAVEAGLRARDQFLAHGDPVAAGRVENNIGNIYFRRDRYREAEQFQRAARRRFEQAGDHLQLAKIDNCLANTRAALLDFRDAERLYSEALAYAERAGLTVTLAEIEGNMGNFALFQGRYDRALDLLESSRRRYEALAMPHQSAIAELELADAHLELNLTAEAFAVYLRVAPAFAALGMRAEQARSLAQSGRAAMLLARSTEAHSLLSKARALYAAEGNMVGEAYVTLTEAQLHLSEGAYAEAAVLAAQAEAPLATAGAQRRVLTARWLRGEAARAQGQERLAQILLQTTLSEAEAQALPQIAERCHTSLGLLAAARGDHRAAEDSFRRAVSLVESLRAPLPGEEFRTAFVADKLAPYDELIRLCLSDPAGTRIAEALAYAERARSRALIETMSGAHAPLPHPRDDYEAELFARLERLREELNWFYSRLDRVPDGEETRGTTDPRALQEAVRERETRTLEIMRQLGQRGGFALVTDIEPFDLHALQSELGADTVLIEYACLDDEIFAFVVTGEGVTAARNLARESEIKEALAQFRFQIESLQHGAARMRSHLRTLTQRARHHLAALYDLLLRGIPTEQLTNARRLVIVPHGTLHYVPFHALHDGEAYVVERREVICAPSAGVLLRCLSKPATRFERALLIGVADEQTPRVREEISALAPLFDIAETLVDEEATLERVRERAPAADVLHLACHGRFRPDSPLFSSLKLGDGWLTVRDASALELSAGLVALSACETGVSALAPGDELLGLVRGFLSAGAAALLLSLWVVDDEATAELMRDFYEHLRGGERPAAALRAAQFRQMREREHPFFWSPFVLTGRW